MNSLESESKATILLPIRKTFCDLIFSGRKKYEYRRSIPKRAIGKVLVYEAAGSGKVIGEFEVGEILSSPIEQLWEMTGAESGSDFTTLSKYFAGCHVCHAISISEPRKFHEPKSLSDLGISFIPQSFVYLKS